MKAKITTLLLLFTVALYSYGEDIKKLKYGKVSSEELTMTRYEKDTSANAVVLYSYGEFDPNNFKFSQHIRIKVLKQTGSSLADMAFSGKLKGTIKGCTYNLENGEVVKSELKKESIFEERVYEKQYVTRIALPNVRVGSVFEVVCTQSGIPNNYDFQKNIPVIYAALSFYQNTYINFKLQINGTLGFAYKDATTWIAKDLPAFKYEPFMKSERDNKLSFEFEPISIQSPQYNKLFCNTWNSVNAIYNENPDFGGLIRGMNFCLNEMVDSINASSKNDEEKAIKAYEIVKRRIKWNKRESNTGSQQLAKTLETKSGNSADINLLLIGLLQKCNISCYPVLFSTKDNGMVSQFSPTVDKFNYVVVAAAISGKTVYLDASQTYLPFGVLPEKLVGCCGFGISKELTSTPTFVIVEPTYRDKIASSNFIKIDSTGVVKGTVAINREEYSAINFKENLKTYTDSAAYIEKLESDNPTFKIDSHNFSNLNNLTTPLKEEIELTIGSASNKDIIVLSPILFSGIKSNPLTQERRTTPISFNKKMDYTTVACIMLPPNYQIQELPQSSTIFNPDKTIRFTYKIDHNDSQINIRIKFTLDKLDFSLSEYGIIRQIFELMAQKQSESIILKKI